MKTIQVWYHANCFDGFGAAFSAWKAWGDKAAYVPCAYGKPAPDVNGADFIYIVDFSFKKDMMIALCISHPKTRFVIIDHHKTAEADLKDLGLVAKLPNLDVHFDMTKSGALLTWEYFHVEARQAGGDEPIAPPELIQYLSDRDLWTFKLQGTREHHAALGSYAFDFDVWEKLMHKNQMDIVAEGVALLRQQTNAVNKIIKNSYIGKVGEFIMPIVNTSVHWSEVGEALLEKYPDYKCAASFTIFEGSIMWSLRSRSKDPEGGADVSEVAKKYGGGGHRNAAGFSAPIP